LRQVIDPRPTDRALAWALFFGLVLSLMLGVFVYPYVGVAVVCVFVPTWFYQTSPGQMWLRLIGTQNVWAARLVCASLVLFGIGMVAGVLAIQYDALTRPINQ
jgi:hypothetical protein